MMSQATVLYVMRLSIAHHKPILFPMYRGGNGGSDGSQKLPTVTQLVSRIRIQSLLSLSLRAYRSTFLT